MTLIVTRFDIYIPPDEEEDMITIQVDAPLKDKILEDTTVTKADLRLYKMIKAMTCTIDTNEMLGRRLGISGSQVVSSLVSLTEKRYVQVETTDRVRYLRA